VSQTIGYARVSATDQNLDLQLDALKATGCDRVFVEKASGAAKNRPQMRAALDYARAGDVLVTWKLDRLGRKVTILADLMEELQARQIRLLLLTDGIDTGTVAGRIVYHILAALAEGERDEIRERAAAGRAAARARGKTGGRPLKLDDNKLEMARMLVAGGASLRQAARAIDVGKTTLHDRLVRKPDLHDKDQHEQSGQGFRTGDALVVVSGVRPSERSTFRTATEGQA
jgi:DNA invertase Pin-like site-specific DNA recombinase